MTTNFDSKFASPQKLSEALDVSRSFLWRLEKAGLLTPYYIYSRKLYLVEDLKRLETLIERGELRAALRGAAAAARNKSKGKEQA